MLAWSLLSPRHVLGRVVYIPFALAFFHLISNVDNHAEFVCACLPYSSIFGSTPYNIQSKKNRKKGWRSQ